MYAMKDYIESKNVQDLIFTAMDVLQGGSDTYFVACGIKNFRDEYWYNNGDQFTFIYHA